MGLRATTTAVEPELLFLPWELPLDEWPEDLTLALPKGISRHTVCFVQVHDSVHAVKETPEEIAHAEFRLLTELCRLGLPCVEPVGVVAGRSDRLGARLPGALVTRHLTHSLPYRALITPLLDRRTGERLMDALVLLLVRLHLTGFAWNDCSLSNTLFRRDAGAFSAYLVDAETGELHPQLSRGQRSYDLETAAFNIMGELLDLQAGGMLDESLDVVAVGDEFRRRYEHLWLTLTEPVTFSRGDRTGVHTLLRTLNGLGFDVAELHAESTEDGASLQVSPKVVEAGHHRRRMRRLTGLSMEENQARRLLNDLDALRAGLEPGHDELVAAHRWVRDTYEHVLACLPADQRGKLEDAELVHEVLEHRWYSSQRAGRDVGLDWAIRDYVDARLRTAPDEHQVLPVAVPDEEDVPGADALPGEPTPASTDEPDHTPVSTDEPDHTPVEPVETRSATPRSSRSRLAPDEPAATPPTTAPPTDQPDHTPVEPVETRSATPRSSRSRFAPDEPAETTSPPPRIEPEDPPDQASP